jgi:hypothetical protein
MTPPLLCRLCNKPRRPATRRTKIHGVCQQCAASIATVSRQKKTPARAEHRKRWKFVASQREDKASRRPTESWWTKLGAGTTLDSEALAKDRDRMKASGASGDNV